MRKGFWQALQAPRPNHITAEAVQYAWLVGFELSAKKINRSPVDRRRRHRESAVLNRDGGLLSRRAAWWLHQGPASAPVLVTVHGFAGIRLCRQ
jgi:hypothetical protein